VATIKPFFHFVMLVSPYLRVSPGVVRTPPFVVQNSGYKVIVVLNGQDTIVCHWAEIMTCCPGRIASEHGTDCEWWICKDVDQLSTPC